MAPPHAQMTRAIIEDAEAAACRNFTLKTSGIILNDGRRCSSRRGESGPDARSAICRDATWDGVLHLDESEMRARCVADHLCVGFYAGTGSNAGQFRPVKAWRGKRFASNWVAFERSASCPLRRASRASSLARMAPAAEPVPPAAFAFATFVNGDAMGDGLRVLMSLDARSWWPLLRGDPVVLRRGLLGQVFRDPSICWLDGWFHLVYTTEICSGANASDARFGCHWRSRSSASPPPRFGYARSRDLVGWEGVRAVELSGHAVGYLCNVWAPEWYLFSPKEVADHGGDVAAVVFSATSATPCPAVFGGSRAKGLWRDMSRAAGETAPPLPPHKPYVVTTADFKTFSAPRLLFDPGECNRHVTAM